MPRAIFTEQAQRDLWEIVDFIAQDSLDAASSEPADYSLRSRSRAGSHLMRRRE